MSVIWGYSSLCFLWVLLSIFLYASWPLVDHFLRIIYSSPLLIFYLIYFCFCWVTGIHYIFWILKLYQIYNLHLFPILMDAFSLCWFSPLIYKEIPFLYFCFFCFCFWYHFHEIIAKFNDMNFLLMFPSNKCIISGLMFRSLVHFELVYR